MNQYRTSDLLKLLIDTIPGYHWWKDLEGRYLGCNSAVVKLLGLNSPKDVIGKTDYELPWAKNATFITTNDLKVITTGERITSEENIMTNNNESLTFFVVKLPLRNSKSEIIGTIGSSVDITDRIMIEKELKAAKKAAEAASEAKSEFLRNMEHQLRTPFAGIYSMVEILAGMEKDPDKKQMLELTYKSAKEFYDLLNNIIDFSRFQVDRMAILAKKVNLRKLIKRAIIMEKAAAAVKKLEVTLKYPKMVPDIFISDETRLERIILNLLGNAIKFTDNGRIEIKIKLAHKENDRNFIIQIVVSDTGIGIAEDKQQLIYEKFYREHPANQNKYSGAGLGLHIVKQLIEDLSGEIEVVSAKGKGSIFTCTLPLKRPLVDKMPRLLT